MDQIEPETARIASKIFTFEDNKKVPKEILTVSIPEVLDPQYGMYVWPCAVVLAQYLWSRRGELRGKKVLELGAGVCLPGVLAALCGSDVVLSDSAASPQCLVNCLRSCAANGLTANGLTANGLTGASVAANGLTAASVETVPLTWGEVTPQLVLLPGLDIILGSDVFYEPKDFEDVIVTVSFLLKKNPTAEFWTTYQERSADWSIAPLLQRWSLSCEDVCLSEFGADKPDVAGSNLPGSHSILMMIITLNTDDQGGLVV